MNIMNMVVRRRLEKRRKGAAARGFTLVEIIVILAIIAILAAIAIPSLIGYIEKADESEVKQNLATCARAMQAWASERYADNLIGQGDLVTDEIDSVNYPGETESLPVPPGYPTISPTSATTWLGIAEEYAKLSLDPDIWTITDVRFDDYNTLLHFWLHRSDPDQKAEYNAVGRDGEGSEPPEGDDPPETEAFESFAFTIIAPDGQFWIPTRGSDSSGSNSVSYSWDVKVDDGEYVTYPSGTGSDNGIDISGQLAATGEPQLIQIRQTGKTNDDNDYQWFRAFGFGIYASGSAGFAENRQKMATLVSPLPTKGMCTGPGQAGNYFGQYMFLGLEGDNFKMGAAFTLPQDITSVGTQFCVYMFGSCTGDSFTMEGSAFNLPQRIISIVATDPDPASSFCSSMFYGCNGSSFTMNDVFNLPPDLASVTSNFCQYMFFSCSGESFQVNEVFQFPQNIPDTWTTYARAFNGTFSIGGEPGPTRKQARSAQSIVGDIGQPSSSMQTFRDVRADPQWSDYDTWLSLPENSNWK